MNCQHSSIKETILNIGPHYGRRDCLECGRFIDWMPNPKTLEKRSDNKARVKTLQSLPMTEWVKGFLASFPEKPSPKQQDCLDKLWSDKK